MVQADLEVAENAHQRQRRRCLDSSAQTNARVEKQGRSLGSSSRRPTWLQGILEANGPEMVLMMQATKEILCMHHAADLSSAAIASSVGMFCSNEVPDSRDDGAQVEHEADQTEAGALKIICNNYDRYIRILQQINADRVPWIDYEPIGNPHKAPQGVGDRQQQHQYSHCKNPDASALRRYALDVGRATVIQAMVNCVAMQRRLVTGYVYGDEKSQLRCQAEAAYPRVRWAYYQAIPERHARRLLEYIQSHEHLRLAGVVGTLRAAQMWHQIVLPDIQRFYDAKENKTHARIDDGTTPGGPGAGGPGRVSAA